MSGQQDPEGKFGFSPRTPADAGGVEPSGDPVADATDRPMTIDGDDLDIEDVTDAPFSDDVAGAGLELELERTAMLSEDMEVAPALDEPSWVEDVKPGDTEEDMPARTMSLEISEHGEPAAAEDPDTDSPEEQSIATEVLDEMEEEEFLPPTGRMEVVTGPDAGASFDVTGESVIVGRGLDCGIVVNDSSVSRKHFRLDREASGYVLVDLGSGNGSIVNGGRVQTLRLTEGARIEAGTTHMVWREGNPGRPAAAGSDNDEVEDPTVVGDLAAVEIDPDWKGEPGAEPQQDPQPAAKPRKHPPTVPVSPRESLNFLDSEDLRTIAWAAVAVVFLVLAFVLVDRIANLGILDGGQQVQMSNTDSGRATELMREGLDAFRDQRWYDAKARFREAMKLDPSVPGGREAIDGVDAELDAWRAVEDADKALDEDAYVEAIASLKKVPDTSTFFPEAQELLRDTREEAMGEALAEARKMADKGNFKEGLQVLNKALELAPEDTDALGLREELRSAQGEQGDKTTDTVASGRSGAKPRKQRPRKKKAGSTEVEKPREAPEDRSDRMARASRGLALYAGANFAGAIDYFDGIANGRGSKRERARAQHLATAITKFDTFWRAGREAVLSGRVDDAIDGLKKARKVDQSISGAYQFKIKGLLARQYAWKAERAYDQGDYSKAGKLARTAVNLDPAEPDGARIYSRVQRKAEAWLAEARSMAASEPERAMDLLARVLSVFSRGDARYQSAYRLLNQLGSEDED